MKRLMNAVILLFGLSMAMMTSCTKDPDNGGNGGNNGGGNNGNTYNGHEYVDLGLPSGTLWATCNVGADTPEGYGDYFAWSDTQPKDYYYWNTCKYSVYDELAETYKFTKYCNLADAGYNGFTDNLTVLLPEDDAATANWGSGWCMPTNEQCIELKNNTTCVETFQNNVKGILLTASNGQSLFLPTAGKRFRGELQVAGSKCHYWSSTVLYPSAPVSFDYNEEGFQVHWSSRYEGFTVRPVRSR